MMIRSQKRVAILFLSVLLGVSSLHANNAAAKVGKCAVKVGKYVICGTALIGVVGSSFDLRKEYKNLDSMWKNKVEEALRSKIALDCENEYQNFSLVLSRLGQFANNEFGFFAQNSDLRKLAFRAVQTVFDNANQSCQAHFAQQRSGYLAVIAACFIVADLTSPFKTKPTVQVFNTLRSTDWRKTVQQARDGCIDVKNDLKKVFTLVPKDEFVVLTLAPKGEHVKDNNNEDNHEK